MNGLERYIIKLAEEQLRLKNFIHLDSTVNTAYNESRLAYPSFIELDDVFSSDDFDEIDMNDVKQEKARIVRDFLGKDARAKVDWSEKIEQLIGVQFSNLTKEPFDENIIFYNAVETAINVIESVDDFLRIVRMNGYSKNTIGTLQGLEDYIRREYGPEDFFKCIRNYKKKVEEYKGDANLIRRMIMELYDTDRQSIGGISVLYRGHSDYQYLPIPSIMRNKGLIEKEREMFNEVTNTNRKEFSGCNSTFEKLSMMQHYGLPTRMLDMTSNPLVALYFACSDEDESKVGEILSYSLLNSEVLYQSDEELHMLSNITLMKENEKRRLSNRVINHCHNCGSRFRRCEEFNDNFLNNRMRFQLGLSKESRVQPVNLIGYQFVMPSNLHDRIDRQSSMFAVYGFTNYRVTEVWNPQQNNVVFVKNKIEILKELSEMKISSFYLFPELESRSIHYKKKYQI